MAYAKKCTGCGQELGEFEGQILTSHLGGFDNYCDECYEEVTTLKEIFN